MSDSQLISIVTNYYTSIVSTFVMFSSFSRLLECVNVWPDGGAYLGEARVAAHPTAQYAVK